jgi:hypothetical protein
MTKAGLLLLGALILALSMHGCVRGTVIDYAPSVPGGSAIAAISTAIIDATGVAGLIAGIAAGLLIIVSVLSGGGKSNYFFCARCDEYLGEMGPTSCPICGSKTYSKRKRG